MRFSVTVAFVALAALALPAFSVPVAASYDDLVSYVLPPRFIFTMYSDLGLVSREYDDLYARDEVYARAPVRPPPGPRPGPPPRPHPPSPYPIRHRRDEFELEA